MAIANIDPSLTKYCPGCGKALHQSAQQCPDCGAPQPGAPGESSRSRIVAAVLALLFGWFGMHKFYLGRTSAGVLYLVFFWTVVPALLALIDAIMLFISSDGEFRAKYG